MTEDPFDFSPLDPSSDRVAFERAVRRIGRSAAPLLAARRSARGPFRQIVRWRRPMIAAAAVIILGSVTALVRLGAMPGTAPSSAAEVLGVPTTLARWAQGDRIPTAGEVVVSLEESR